jgi:hypothetical protein
LGFVNPAFRRPIGENGSFPPFSPFGTADAISLAWLRDGPAADQRRYKMTLSLHSLQSLAISLIGAVVASSLFLSAAMGPVTVI